jgi:hypothetical protein
MSPSSKPPQGPPVGVFHVRRPRLAAEVWGESGSAPSRVAVSDAMGDVECLTACETAGDMSGSQRNCQ